MKRIKACAHVPQVSRQADALEVSVKGPFFNCVICQGVEYFSRNPLTAGKVNDSHITSVHGIAKQENLERGRFRVPVYAALVQINVREGLNIYRYA